MDQRRLTDIASTSVAPESLSKLTGVLAYVTQVERRDDAPHEMFASAYQRLHRSPPPLAKGSNSKPFANKW